MAVPDFVGKGESGMEKALRAPEKPKPSYAPVMQRLFIRNWQPFSRATVMHWQCMAAYSVILI